MAGRDSLWSSDLDLDCGYCFLGFLEEPEGSGNKVQGVAFTSPFGDYSHTFTNGLHRRGSCDLQQVANVAQEVLPLLFPPRSWS